MRIPPDIPQALPPKPLPTRIKALIAQARAVLLWETYAPAYFLGALAILLYMAGAFAGVWERIGDPWRAVALIAAIALLLRSIWKARNTRTPSRSDAQRRLEADNKLSHRPLDVIEDSPRVTERGWNAHLARSEAATASLRAARPRPVLRAHDPYHLRHVLPVLLVGALFIGWGDNFERLRRALVPTWQSAINPANASFEAWIDPPDYTGRRPVTLKENNLSDVPEGSEFVARITGIADMPRLLLETDGRDRRLSPTRLGPQSFEVRGTLNTDATARIRIGQRRQVWTLDVIADTPPTVAFAETPKADKRDRLNLIYDFADDYGVERLQLELVPLIDTGDTALGPETVDIPLSAASIDEADDQRQTLDLSRHRWAGRKARGHLIATDGKGQTAISDTAYFTIPNKIFIEPLAKAIVEQRAHVLDAFVQEDAAYEPERTYAPYALFDTWEPGARLSRAPAPLQRATELIDAVTQLPAGAFDDPALYMGLRNAASRLRYARDMDALAGLDEDLWSMAIRAEFGRLGTALEAMRRAQTQLNDAIARNAPQREVDVLFERYNEAVDRYLDVLREEAEIMDPVAGGGGGAGGRNVDEIQELLDAIEEAQRIGDTEGARLALAKLAELLENMEMQLTPSGGGSGEGDPQSGGEMSEEMKEALEELAELLGEQRDLRDDTERAQNDSGGDSESDQGDPQSGSSGQGGEEPQQDEGGQGSLTPGELAQRQEQLGEGLAEMRQALPEDEVQGLGEGGQESEQALQAAEDAMDRAEAALGQGDYTIAQDEQDEAIRQLRNAGRTLAESLRDQQRGNQDGENDGEEDGAGQNPLGQEQGGENDPNVEQDIDPRDDRQRSREILEELRRRAAEQERSQEELNYLERLLKRF